MRAKNNIAIIGAGVAGLAFALLAARQGHSVHIFERRQLGKQMGAGVTLWPNATFVLEAMGLLAQIRTAACQPHWLRRFSPQGDNIGQLSVTELDKLIGYPSLTILRRDLMGILVGALAKTSVEITDNHAIDADRLAVLSQQYDLVIGADGRMHSMARQYVAPTARAVYQGFVNVIGISQCPSATLNQPDIVDFCGNAQRFGIVPVSNNQCYWAAAWPTPLDCQDALNIQQSGLAKRFAHWPQTVRSILNFAQPDSIKPIFVHDIEPLTLWHRDNVLLLGDAAHASLPTSGQGACQALEDAWILAELLQNSPGTATLFNNFQSRRQSKTTEIQRMGRQLAQALFSPGSKPEQKPVSVAHSPARMAAFYMAGLVTNPVTARQTDE